MLPGCGGGGSARPASAPEITAITPASGVPGAEVVLEGRALAGPTRLTFAGRDLPAGRFDADGDSRIRVRIPDDAQDGGVIAVSTAAGTAQAPAFTLLPSRRAAFPKALEKITGTYDSGTWVNFPAGGRSAIYNLLEPTAPVFHAYHPGGEDGTGSGNRPGHLFTRYSLNLKLPAPFQEALPASVKAGIADAGLNPADVDILCASQDYQYDGVTPDLGIYLFRPHYWTDPGAPATGKYVQPHTLTAGIFEADAGVTIDGHAPGVMFPFGILTHGDQDPLTKEPLDSQILVSGNTQPMAGFDTGASTGLWSLTREGTRAAATLHLLFNDGDQAALDGITAASGTLQDLVTAMDKAVGASRGTRMLKALFRPMASSATRSGATVTLAGTCLGGATAVLLDGKPVAGLKALSDAVVRVDLPAGTTGKLQVVTPLGTSDPVQLD
ncbi:hypothetical protein [Geothrix sp. 21YS21S-2]|uniref:hypothetical protein n=1 Tax=Geothrix sp. 21YS21S-2 TaxID=3068893 RepID=UPI0027B9F6B7|nr:hypothetical protein [Geothrix sp. 21YS21S-2]